MHYYLSLGYIMHFGILQTWATPVQIVNWGVPMHKPYRRFTILLILFLFFGYLGNLKSSIFITILTKAAKHIYIK